MTTYLKVCIICMIMSRKAKSEASKTRKRILSSALTLFIKKGYDKTTFVDIADSLNMTKGAVYWHFDTKHDLLAAVIDDMLSRFRKNLLEIIRSEESDFSGLSFRSFSEEMVKHALKTVADKKNREFFLFMNEQVRWADDSMDKVRESIMKNKSFGPWEAFNIAVKNDIKRSLVKPDVKSEQVASCCMALWSGLTRSKISNFLKTDLEETLANAYKGIWESIKL